MAENVSKCSVDTVPIQIINSLRYGKVITFSDAKFASGTPSYNNFIKTVTEHLMAKLAQENLCLDSAESQERSLIKFVFMHIANPTANPGLPPARSSGVCRISSPWIDIAIEREPVPSVQAIVRHNERQLLTDQAVLAGALDVPPGVAMPLTVEELDRYISLYQYPEVDIFIGNRSMEKPIEELVPPDILWLLKHTRYNDMPGLEMQSLRAAIDWSAEGYTKIVTGLVDQCFVSDGADKQYSSILDITYMVPLEQYKIVTPFIERRVR